jgi:hypothetical protein
LKAACVLGGVVLGSQIQKFVEKKNAVSGTDLFGLDGDLSKYTASGIVTAAGVIGSFFVPNKIVKDVALGTAIAGISKIINTATGKQIVALGDTDENPNAPIILPGIGAAEELPYLPGIGAGDGIHEAYEYAINPALAQQPLQGNEQTSLY